MVIYIETDDLYVIIHHNDMIVYTKWSQFLSIKF